MNTIQIIGLGAGDVDDLSLRAYKALTSGVPNYVRSVRHPVVSSLKKNGVKIDSFDEYFEQLNSFDEIYFKITAKIVELSEKYDTINYCTAGSPFFGDIVTKKLISEYKNQFNIIIIDGMSFLDKCLKLSECCDFKSIKVLDCLEADEFSFDVNSVNIITQIYDEEMASEIKIKLMEVYPEEIIIQKIDVVTNNVKEIPLYMLDRDKNYDFSTYFCIKPIEIFEKTVYNVNNLLRIVKILRGPNGCPWDRKQTHKSLRQYVVEEAYEVADAIDNEDDNNLMEELGDLLLQVVLHAQIASEEGYFNINDIISGICVKMQNRHPHVFGDLKAENAQDVVSIWQLAKQKEKGFKSYTDKLKDIPKSLSTLARSYKLQKRLADEEFIFTLDVSRSIDKIKEELSEFLDEYIKLDYDNMEAEFGDLLFAIVNFAGFVNINPDIALNRTINKFIARFEYMEKNANKDLKEMTLSEVDELWQQSKIPFGIDIKK